MLSLDQLKQRQEELESCLIKLDTDLSLTKDKAKILKKEISNGKGALVEVERMIEMWD